jgi:hypothetical protein
MASSRVAFERLSTWKNDRTVLTLTVVNIVDDEPSEDTLQGNVVFVDDDKMLVGFVDVVTRKPRFLRFRR